MTSAPIFRARSGVPSSRTAVDNDDLRDEIGGQIGKHTANGLRFVMGRNDDRYSHADSLITTTGTRGAAVPATRRCPKRGLARPIASPSDASTGTSSSQIQDVPNSETQRLPRYRKAIRATGRVSRPMTSRIPSEISITACSGAAMAAWLTMIPITHFHSAGEWLFLM